MIAGPFIDFSGTVEEVNDDKQKVKIVISIFGRLTPVELDYFKLNWRNKNGKKINWFY